MKWKLFLKSTEENFCSFHRTWFGCMSSCSSVLRNFSFLSRYFVVYKMIPPSDINQNINQTCNITNFQNVKKFVNFRRTTDYTNKDQFISNIKHLRQKHWVALLGVSKSDLYAIKQSIMWSIVKMDNYVIAQVNNT